MLCGTCYYNKKIKVENVAESAKNCNKCPDVSRLCPSSVECSLMFKVTLTGTGSTGILFDRISS